MEIVNCFAIDDDIKLCNNVLKKFLCKEQYNLEKHTHVCIGFRKYTKSISYTNHEEKEILINARIVEHNANKITELASKDNINFANIKRNIINQFKENGLFLYTYSKIEMKHCEAVTNCEMGYSEYYVGSNGKKAIRIHKETDNDIYKEIKYNNVDEMAWLILNINNQLNDLGKTIELYQSNDKSIIKNIKNLEPIILVQKKILIESPTEYENFNYSSIDLETLIDKLIKPEYILYSLEEICNINSLSYKCRKGKCADKEYDKLCDLCKSNEGIVKYKICEGIIDKILKSE